MPSKDTLGLPPADPLDGTELIHIVQRGNSREAPIGLLPPGPPGPSNNTFLSRAAIAALGVVVAFPGNSAVLTEQGRGGTFIFSGTDFVAALGASLATIDPRQAIYIAPDFDPTGASGAWVRANATILPGLPGHKQFHLEWWGMTSTLAVGVAELVQAAADMLPDGFTLHHGDYVHLLEATVSFNSQGFLQGVRGRSKYAAADPASAYWPNRNLVQMTNSNSGSDGIIYEHPRHLAEAGGGFGLAFGAYYRSVQNAELERGLSRLASNVENIRVTNNGFVNGSEGLLFIADISGGEYRPVKNVRVHGNGFTDLDYQAISWFGVLDFVCSHNFIKMAPHRVNELGQAIGFAAVMRIMCGSADYHIHHNTIVGLGLNSVDGSDHRSCVFWLAGMNLDGFQVRSQGSGTIDDNSCSNARQLVMADVGCQGTITVEGNKLLNPDTTAIVQCGPVLASPDDGSAYGTAYSFDELIFRNNTYRGVSNGHLHAGNIKRLVLDGDKLFWGALAVDGTQNCIQTQTFGGTFRIDRLEANRNKFFWPDGASEQYCDIDVHDAAATAVVMDNEFPEGTPTFGFVGGRGAGKIMTNRTDGYVLATGAIAQGDNNALMSGAGGGGGGGGGGPTERFPNPDFASGADVTLGAGASISGGALHTGLTQWDASYEVLLGSYADGEVYQIEIDVASVGDGVPKFDMGPSWALSGIVSGQVLVAGLNSFTATIDSAHAGTDMRGSIMLYGAGATAECVINSVSCQKIP